jgi:hypothetical protein
MTTLYAINPDGRVLYKCVHTKNIAKEIVILKRRGYCEVRVVS